MQIPDHFEPSLYAAALDQMSGALRKEAQRVSPSPEGLSLNTFATEFHKLALAMDGLSLRRTRQPPNVGTKPTDGSAT